MKSIEISSYGCPVQCKYCVVTKVDKRRTLYEKSSVLGINKSVTILNSALNKEEFYNFPIELLKGDIVGFNGISDPFWDIYSSDLDWFINHVAPVAKLITCVTKWNVTDKVLNMLKEIPNFRLIVSITGLDQLEKTTTYDRLSLLERAKKMDIKAFPIIHPYIPGMTNLSFLSDLNKLGYDKIDVKGLRYSEKNMDSWMPSHVKKYFRNSNEDEILVDGFLNELTKSNLLKIPLKDWYREDFDQLYPKLSTEEATDAVDKLLHIANITSSDTDSAVRHAAICRRL